LEPVLASLTAAPRAAGAVVPPPGGLFVESGPCGLDAAVDALLSSMPAFLSLELSDFSVADTAPRVAAAPGGGGDAPAAAVVAALGAVGVSEEEEGEDYGDLSDLDVW
jgi:hypothetical protein